MKTVFLKVGSLALLVVALAAPVESADSVYLKTGELFSGKILRVNDREVSIQLESGGIMSFRLGQVRRMKRWVRGEIFPRVIEMDDQGNVIRSDGNEFDESNASDETTSPTTSTSPPAPTGRPPSPTEPEPVTPPNLPTVAIPGSDEVVSVRAEPTKIADPPPRGSALSTSPLTKVAARTPTETWSIHPPVGFESRDEAEPRDVLESWVEPVSQTLVTLALYEDDASVEDFKQRVVRESPGTTTPRIFRDIPLNRDGEGGFEGWILETEQDIAGAPVRQVQLFVHGDTGTYVLRCTSPAFLYPRLSPAFEESLHSFRLYRRPDASRSGAASNRGS